MGNADQQETRGMILTTTRTAVCEKHGEFEQQVISMPFFELPVFSQCPRCIEEEEYALAEKAKDGELEKEKVFKLDALEKMGIRRRFYEATFDTYTASNQGQMKALEVCRDYAGRREKIVSTGESLFLIGRPGTGKNHLAISILREWGKGRIVKLSEMVREIRLSYSDGSSEQGRIESFARMPLLILNEVGVQRGTDAERNLVFEVLDMRYENMLPTVLISNLNIQGIKDFIGGRVIDRLMECAQVVEFTWDSYRGNSK